MERSANDVAILETAAHGGRRVEHEGPRLAKRKEPKDVVEVAVGEDHRADGRVAWASRMKGLVVANLLENIGRGIDEVPRVAVRRKRQRVLRARPHAGVAATHRGAIGAPTVPLREAA